jgi:PAS domain S-box-containing protein
VRDAPNDAATVAADLLDRAPCGFVSFGNDGCVRLANATLLDMLGFTREELIGRHVEEILTMGTRVFYQTHWFPLLRLHGEAEEIFLQLRPRSGDPIGVLVNGVRHERDGVACYDCVLMEVRERQKFEEELLRARREAERVSAELAAQKQQLEEANRQLEAQANELELQQQQLQELAGELADRADALERTNDQLRSQTEEAEQLRAEADAANEAKSSFLAVMSHELRTPLNAISGYTAILDMGIHGPVNEAQRDTLGKIDRSQRHLLRLINEILNLARIEAGHIDYQIVDVEVAALVAGVTPMIEPQLESRGIAFHVQVEPRLAVRADTDRAQQVLLNLLSNAAKFTAAGGVVTVSAATASAAPGQVEILVSDTGVGIPEDKLEAIFDPFVQVDTRGHRTAEGTGLGLAISRDLARGMGGDLTAHSVPSAGSTFVFRLPRVEP